MNFVSYRQLQADANNQVSLAFHFSDGCLSTNLHRRLLSIWGMYFAPTERPPCHQSINVEIRWKLRNANEIKKVNN